MTELGKILKKVGRIVENSPDNTITEISNISTILEVDKKTATILHFVYSDQAWNPQTLNMLEDIMGKLPIKEQKIDQSPEKRKEIKDFYLIEYLNRTWKDSIIRKAKQYSEMKFFDIWMKSITTEMINDVIKLNLIPKEYFSDNLIINKYIGGNGRIYKPISDWLTNVMMETDIREYLEKGY